MKIFDTHTFKLPIFEKELSELKDLLDKQQELEETKLLQFFRDRYNLSSLIATLFPHVIKPEKIAFEYDIFGDFAADLVIGDTSTNTYCFIEFENAESGSLFVKKKNKYKPEFSPRFEHGT